MRVEVRDCAHVSRNVAFRVCLLRSTVRNMSAAVRMWLSHLDNGLSCGGSARTSAQHGRSVQDVSFASGRGHGSPLGMPPFALIPRGAGSRRDGAATMRCGVMACGRGGAVALGTPRETWHGR